MKKLTALLLGLVLVFSFAACSSNTDNTPSETDLASAPSASDSAASDEMQPQSSDGSNVLVVYFSASGNTERAANYIADATGGDLFELVPADPYTDADLDWTDEDSRVVYEYENENARDVRLRPIRSTTGTSMTLCSSAIPSGGASPRGRSTIL